MLTSPEGVDRTLRDAGDPSSRQSRPAFAFRPADRFSRRGGENCRRTSRCWNAREPESNCSTKIFRRPARPFFPFPPPAPLERRAKALDGLRTQTREAGGVQCASFAGGCAECFSEIVGDRQFCLDQVRHHARHRHANAARCRPATGRHDGPSVEPSGIRSGARDCHRRLRHPATAGGREPAGRRTSWFVRLFAGDVGIDPYTRDGLGRVSGCFPGGLVHRQRNLRRGRFPTGAGRAFSGKPCSATICWKRAMPAPRSSAT